MPSKLENGTKIQNPGIKIKNIAPTSNHRLIRPSKLIINENELSTTRDALQASGFGYMGGGPLRSNLETAESANRQG